MQIKEISDFSFRVALYLLKKDNLEFVPIPMCHIGSKEFYQDVMKEMDKCDKILYEGVRVKGAKFMTYEKVAKRLGLTAQYHEVEMKKYKEKLIHADFDEQKAQEEWGKVAWTERFAFKVFTPIFFTIAPFFLNKRKFAKLLKNDNELVDYDPLKDDKPDSLDLFMLKKREDVIFQEVDKIMQNDNGEIKRIGILYGAGHMRNVIHYLKTKYKFKMKDSWFLTVFGFDD